MKKRRELLWLSASIAALMLFSFTAGYGLRELYALAHGSSGRQWEAAQQVLSSYRRIASRNGAGVEPDLGPPQLYLEVLDRLRALYVDKLPENTLLSYSSIEQMLATLDDPNTRLLMPAEATALKAAEEGNLTGLGAVLTVKRYPTTDRQSSEREITVVAPLPGSPAEKAGLLPGDRITEMDGKWIAPLHLHPREMSFFTDRGSRGDAQWRKDRASDPDDDEKPQNTPEQRKQAQEAADRLANRWRTSTDIRTAVELLMTTPGGDHMLTIERAGQPKPRQVKVTFAALHVAPVLKRLLPGNIGYLQLRQISPEAVPAVEAALKELHENGATSLVLDLRRSPGGSLEAAEQIAGLFVSSGSVGWLQVRDDKHHPVEKSLAIKPAATGTVPKFGSIAVLVDGGTAGSSEVLAGALHDLGVTRLFGSPTFGDGTEQTILPLDDGAAVSITSGKFLTPKRVDFDEKGLKPDVLIPAAPGLDRQLEQAVKSLRA
jgi:carboxyl-terminal processing protease